jgi:hypothetical protein
MKEMYEILEIMRSCGGMICDTIFSPQYEVLTGARIVQLVWQLGDGGFLDVPLWTASFLDRIQSSLYLPPSFPDRPLFFHVRHLTWPSFSRGRLFCQP